MKLAKQYLSMCEASKEDITKMVVSKKTAPLFFKYVELFNKKEKFGPLIDFTKDLKNGDYSFDDLLSFFKDAKNDSTLGSLKFKSPFMRTNMQKNLLLDAEKLGK